MNEKKTPEQKKKAPMAAPATFPVQVKSGVKAGEGEFDQIAAPA